MASWFYPAAFLAATSLWPLFLLDTQSALLIGVLLAFSLVWTVLVCYVNSFPGLPYFRALELVCIQFMSGVFYLTLTYIFFILAWLHIAGTYYAVRGMRHGRAYSQMRWFDFIDAVTRRRTGHSLTEAYTRPQWEDTSHTDPLSPR